MDWREFVESQSVVEQVLRTDPADVYADMDFHTRDSYRHTVERAAIGSFTHHGLQCIASISSAAREMPTDEARCAGDENVLCHGTTI